MSHKNDPRYRAVQSAPQSYDLASVRDLLSEAFSPEELRRFLYDSPTFRPVIARISSQASLGEMVDVVIEYAYRQLLLAELLNAVKRSNPRQYARFEPYVRLEGPPPESTEVLLEHAKRPETYTEPLENPYVVGNPIQPESMRVFLGRYDIARAIISEINKSGQKPSILLYGRRRMGKTSALLNITRLMRDPNILSVYVSGQSVKFHTNVNFCYYLVRAIIQALEENFIDTSGLQQSGYLTKNTFASKPVLTLSEFFDECHELLGLGGKHCLLSIDEYEEIDSHINTGPGDHNDDYITKELLLELRETLQHKPRFVFLFCGTHFLRDLSTVNWSEIFINVRTLHISFLDRTDGHRLLTEPVQDLRYQDSGLIEQVLDITGCQPFLLQAIASGLINAVNSRETRTVTQEILDEVIDEALSNHNTYFDYVWDTECSNERQQKLLKLVASEARGIPVSGLAANRSELRALVGKEVLRIESGMAELTMPIVKLWMKKHQHIL